MFIHSVAESLADKHGFAKELVDKWLIKPSLADKLGDILAFLTDKGKTTTENIIQEFDLSATTARRYLHQLVELGYVESHGANKNRTYHIKK